MERSFHKHWISDAVAALSDSGFYCGSEIFDPAVISATLSRVRDLDAGGQFAPAGTGRLETRAVHADVRGDRIFWLDPGRSPVDDGVLRLTDHIKESLNRELFTGLRDFEGHYAIYPPGSFYRRHIDAFKSDDARMITFILYLNESWKPEDGGQLRVYTGDAFTDYDPLAGRIILFKSRDFPHEVLTAHRERASVTGWFRVRQGQRRL